MSFDVGAVLGIDSPLPDAAAGEIVVRVPDGISLRSVCHLAVAQGLMRSDNSWYALHPWTSQPLSSGTYRLRLPIPNSNNKMYAEQRQLLVNGEKPAPAALVALALLCMQREDKLELPHSNWLRCAEVVDKDRHAGVCWDNGRLTVIWPAPPFLIQVL